jgi:glutaconyl-CoA/methylmalonyl-CoA decarboxylase subunit gamma
MEHLRITVEGKVYDVVVEKIDSDETDNPTPSAQLVRPAASVQASPMLTPAAPAPAPPASVGDALSPLAGIVKSIEVGPGTKVSEGDLIITLEAMKMYTAINAPTGGTVTSVHVKIGDAVEEGQALYTIG